MATKPARNAEYLKEYNRKKFLSLLRRNPMSRADVSRELGITRAATSLIADALMEEGLVRELPPEKLGTTRGKPSNPLALEPDSLYAVGISLKRGTSTAGVVDICGNVLCTTEIKVHQDGDQIYILERTVRTLVEQAGIPWEKLVGVGISAPGPLDGENGTILNPPDFPLWQNLRVSEPLEKSLGVPVFLENDASSFARYQLGKPETHGSEDFLLLMIKNGVGSGVISRGKLLKGAGYFTTELGHCTIAYNGRPCSCGNRGCLETYAGMEQLLADTPYDTWQQVVDRSRVNSDASALLAEEFDYLAAAICNLATIVPIDTVLMAGDLAYHAQDTSPLLEQKVNRQLLRRNTLPIRVYPAYMGQEPAVNAAADIAFGRYLLV